MNAFEAIFNLIIHLTFVCIKHNVSIYTDLCSENIYPSTATDTETKRNAVRSARRKETEHERKIWKFRIDNVLYVSSRTTHNSCQFTNFFHMIFLLIVFYIRVWLVDTS